MNFEPLTERQEQIAAKIVDAAFTVHEALGPGLLERIYETCFCNELQKRGLALQRQFEVPIHHDGVVLAEMLRLDIMVENLVICEIKAVEQMYPVYKAQLLSYLRLTGKRLGFLINFNVPVIKQGIQRFIR